MNRVMQAVVLSFDRLPISFLGCYGNSSVRTPAFDRLAARSVVFDQHFAERIGSDNGPIASAASHAWTTGCYHFPRSPEQQAAMPKLADVLRGGSVETTLIAEARSGIPVPGFDRVIEVGGRDGLAVPFEATPFAELVSRSESILAEETNGRKPARLLWLKSRGVPRPWIPPRPFARAAIERGGESRPAAGEDPRNLSRFRRSQAAALRGEVPLQPPAHDSPGGTQVAGGDERAQVDGTRSSDTDSAASVLELTNDRFDQFVGKLVAAATNVPGISQDPWDVSERNAREEPATAAGLSTEDWHRARSVLAGYVELLDRSLGRLLDLIDEQFAAEELLLVITAAEGMPAGERRMMSLSPARLPEETVHTPLIVHVSGGDAGTRRQALVQTVDLAPTLCEWFQLEAEAANCEGRSWLGSALKAGLCESGSPGGRDFICLGDGERAAGIRTPERYLVSQVREGDVVAGSGRLTVKPDDVWDVHDVAAQSPDEVEMLSSTLGWFIRRARAATPLEWPPLQVQQ